MIISNLQQGFCRILLTACDFEGLRQCLNEAIKSQVVKDFDKWIGVSRQYVENILAEMPSRRTPGTAWGSIESGLLVEMWSHDEVFVHLTISNLRVLRNCLFEVCNHIKLFEFRLRIGIELREALVILDAMTSYLDQRRS